MLSPIIIEIETILHVDEVSTAQISEKRKFNRIERKIFMWIKKKNVHYSISFSNEKQKYLAFKNTDESVITDTVKPLIIQK